MDCKFVFCLSLMMRLASFTLSCQSTQSNQLDYGCEVDQNETLKNLFLLSVRDKHIDMSTVETYVKQFDSRSYGEINLPDGCQQRTWCVELYNPDCAVKACASNNGSLHQTAAAEKLNLLKDISLETCREKGNSTCLRLHAQIHYHQAYVTVICNQTMKIYEITISNPYNDGRIIADKTVYAAYGDDVQLHCSYFTYEPNFFFKYWLVDGLEITTHCETDHEYTEHLCFIDSQQHESESCLTRLYEEKLYLHINNVTELDEMTYTCKFIPIFGTETAESRIPLIIVPPVHEPVLKKFPTSPSMKLMEGGMTDIVCIIEAGQGASVFWLDPNRDIINATKNSPLEGSGDVDRIFVSMTNVSLENYTVEYTAVLTINDMNNSLAGTYACVVDDPGYPGHNVHTEFELLISIPIGVTSSSLISASMTPTTLPEKKLIFVAVGLSIGTVIFVFFITLLFVILWLKLVRSTSKGCATIGLEQIDPNSTSFDQNFFNKQDIIRNDDLSFKGHYQLEFSRKQLRDFKPLSKGTFGQVYVARIEGTSETIDLVAVKTPKYLNSPREQFHQELQVMVDMGPHPNIIKLLGFCTYPADEQPFLILEYAHYGNLKQFLKTCLQATPNVHARQYSSSSGYCSCSTLYTQKSPLSAQNSNISTTTASTYIVTSGNTSRISDYPPPTPCPDSPSHECTCDDTDHHMLPHYKEECLIELSNIKQLTHDYINDPQQLVLQDIHNFAMQIASGLQHLQNNNVIHCDLAARNILLTHDYTIKIADFGMARCLNKTDYKCFIQRDHVPVKWTAPESLDKWIYTHKSDIWSFGILLWEIFTYGETPFSELEVSFDWSNIITFLQEGNRLQLPQNCPCYYYELMHSCWHLDPKERPTATELLQSLAKNFVP